MSYYDVSPSQDHDVPPFNQLDEADVIDCRGRRIREDSPAELLGRVPLSTMRDSSLSSLEAQNGKESGHKSAPFLMTTSVGVVGKRVERRNAQSKQMRHAHSSVRPFRQSSDGRIGDPFPHT